MGVIKFQIFPKFKKVHNFVGSGPENYGLFRFSVICFLMVPNIPTFYLHTDTQADRNILNYWSRALPRVGFYRAVLQRCYPKYLEIESKYWSIIMCFVAFGIWTNILKESLWNWTEINLIKNREDVLWTDIFSNLNLLIPDINQFFPE